MEWRGPGEDGRPNPAPAARLLPMGDSARSGLLAASGRARPRKPARSPNMGDPSGDDGLPRSSAAHGASGGKDAENTSSRRRRP